MAVLSFPSSPSSGTRYVSPNGDVYFYDGKSWNSDGYSLNPNPIGQDTFKYRTIYTRGYLHCGYKDSSPWRNTNRTVHMTDTTVNLGDMMDYTANYINGGFSDYYTYIFPNNISWNGTSTFVSSMSMITESLRAHQTSWDLKIGRQDSKVLMNPGLTAIYIQGGSTTTEKFNTITDTMVYSGYMGTCPAGSGGYLGCFTGFFGQYYGTIGANSASSKLDFSNETWSANRAWSFDSSVDGIAKGLSSKWGFGYTATTNVTGTTYKFNDTTLTQITTIARPESNGEENMQIGQDWGYALGSYNGAQTNNTQKQYYTSDTQVAMGSDTQPKGHGGASSGCCGTGSCVLLGGTLGTNI